MSPAIYSWWQGSCLVSDLSTDGSTCCHPIRIGFVWFNWLSLNLIDCSPLFTIVHHSSPLFTVVHHCSPLITIVHVWCLVNLTIIVGFSQRILNNFNIPLHPLSNPKFAEGLNLQNLGRNLGFHSSGFRQSGFYNK